MKIIQDNVLIFVGDNRTDYRSLLSERTPINVNDYIITDDRMIKMEQIASDEIFEVKESDAGAGFIEGKSEIARADGIITRQKNLFLCVRTADCYPIIFFDKVKEVVAVAHSGREGTRLNICGKMIQKMKAEYNCNPSDIHIIIGPGISESNYEVDEQTFQEFVQTTEIKQNYRKLDLVKVLYLQIEKEGVPIVNIQSIPICTYENHNYFSYRRDKTKNRQISVIGIIR